MFDVDYQPKKVGVEAIESGVIFPGIQLPEWCKSLEPHQGRVIPRILEAFSRKRNVILEAPTGAGKTLIAHQVSKYMGVRALYVCTTKSLQEQFLNDFKEASVLMGRSNYSTSRGSCDGCSVIGKKKEEGEVLNCKICQKNVHGCPYLLAKRRAASANIAVLNTAYFLSFIEGAKKDCGKDVGFRDRGLAIFDEGHELDSSLQASISIIVPAWLIKKHLINPPSESSHWKKRIEFVKRVKEKLALEIAFAKKDEDFKTVSSLESMSGSISIMLKHSEDLEKATQMAESWCYSVLGSDVEIKPVMVAEYGEKLFGACKRNLIMSATIVCPDDYMKDLGLSRENTEFIGIGSVFPPERRPFFVRPVANVVRAQIGEARPKLAAEIKRIIDTHPGQRAIVHTVSYELAEWLFENTNIKNGILYKDSFSKRNALARFRKTPGSCLFAASVDTGEDFRDDDCRLNIIAKVPWPNKGDKFVSRRCWQPTKFEGELWYLRQAISKIMQMYGRSTRHKLDWSRTFCLDQQFLDLYKVVKSMVGDWFTTAVTFGSYDPLLEIGIK